MLRQVTILILVVIVALSCDNDNRPPKPSNLISKEKMANILYDLYIINAAKGVNKKVFENRNLVPETYVLTKYNIDSLQFAESNKYYAFDTEDYNAIVESVKSRLQEQKKELEDLQKKEQEDAKRKRDSIKAKDKPKTEPNKKDKEKA